MMNRNKKTKLLNLLKQYKQHQLNQHVDGVYNFKAKLILEPQQISCSVRYVLWNDNQCTVYILVRDNKKGTILQRGMLMELTSLFVRYLKQKKYVIDKYFKLDGTIYLKNVTHENIKKFDSDVKRFFGDRRILNNIKTSIHL